MEYRNWETGEIVIIAPGLGHSEGTRFVNSEEDLKWYMRAYAEKKGLLGQFKEFSSRKLKSGRCAWDFSIRGQIAEVDAVYEPGKGMDLVKVYFLIRKYHFSNYDLVIDNKWIVACHIYIACKKNLYNSQTDFRSKFQLPDERVVPAQKSRVADQIWNRLSSVNLWGE